MINDQISGQNDQTRGQSDRTSGQKGRNGCPKGRTSGQKGRISGQGDQISGQKGRTSGQKSLVTGDRRRAGCNQYARCAALARAAWLRQALVFDSEELAASQRSSLLFKGARFSAFHGPAQAAFLG